MNIRLVNITKPASKIQFIIKVITGMAQGLRMSLISNDEYLRKEICNLICIREYQSNKLC